MATLVTLTLLLDEGDEARVHDGLNDMLRTAQKPVEEGDPSWIVDWSFGEVRPVLPELDDSIANETYAEGDLGRDWVAFSRDQRAYWSNGYGWTTLDLATKFDPSQRELPGTDPSDVVWMLAPYHG